MGEELNWKQEKNLVFATKIVAFVSALAIMVSLTTFAAIADSNDGTSVPIGLLIKTPDAPHGAPLSNNLAGLNGSSEQLGVRGQFIRT